MSLTYPTFLTCVRLALIPLIVSALADRSLLGALILFLVAALSDLFDGFLARKWHQESSMGALLDPLADKLLIITSYIMLMGSTFYRILPHWFVWTIIVKEVLLVGGAFYLCVWKKQLPARPLLWGKASMVVQSSFALWLLVCMAFGYQPGVELPYLMVFVLIFVGGSFFHYARQFFKKTY